jgi:hypothetical protein
MNDYLTAIAALEITHNRPRPAWTHRPYPRSRKRVLAPRIAGLFQRTAARRAAPAPS